MTGETPSVYVFGPYRLNVPERMLTRSGEPVSLPPKVFDTLVVLVSNHGHLVDKEKLLHEIWPDSFVEEANLSVNVSALRKALGDAPDGRAYIETVAKRGYRFVAEVRGITEDGINHWTPARAADQPGEGADSSKPELEPAVRETQLACDEHEHFLKTARVDPLFDSLRRDSRFRNVQECADRLAR